MGCAIIMSGLVPYTSPYARHGYGYGYPYGGYPAYGAGYYGGYGAAYGVGYPYGPYGMTAEDIQKVREAEEKAFNEAEAKREEFVAAEKKKYEDYVAAQEAAVKEAIAKEKELAEKLGPYAYGPYGPAGAYGGRYGYGYGPAFYGYGYPYGYGRYYTALALWGAPASCQRV